MSKFLTCEEETIIEWDGVEGSISYEVELSSFDVLIYSVFTGSTRIKVRDLVRQNPGGYYKIRVRALDGKIPGQWTEMKLLSCTLKPAPPQKEVKDIPAPFNIRTSDQKGIAHEALEIEDIKDHPIDPIVIPEDKPPDPPPPDPEPEDPLGETVESLGP